MKDKDFRNFAGASYDDLQDPVKMVSSFCMVTVDRLEIVTGRCSPGYLPHEGTLPAEFVDPFLKDSLAGTALVDEHIRYLENGVRSASAKFATGEDVHVINVKNHTPKPRIHMVPSSAFTPVNKHAEHFIDTKDEGHDMSEFALEERDDYNSDEESQSFKPRPSTFAPPPSSYSSTTHGNSTYQQPETQQEAAPAPYLPNVIYDDDDDLPQPPSWASRCEMGFPGHRSRLRPGDWIDTGEKDAEQNVKPSPAPLTEEEKVKVEKWYGDCSGGAAFMLRELVPHVHRIEDSLDSKHWKDRYKKMVADEKEDLKQPVLPATLEDIGDVIIGLFRNYTVALLVKVAKNKLTGMMHLGHQTQVNSMFGDDKIESAGFEVVQGELFYADMDKVRADAHITKTLYDVDGELFTVYSTTLLVAGKQTTLRWAALRPDTECTPSEEQTLYRHHSPELRDQTMAPLTPFEAVKFADLGHGSVYFHRMMFTPRQLHERFADPLAWLKTYQRVPEGGHVFNYFKDVLVARNLHTLLPCHLRSQVKLLVHGLMHQDAFLSGGPGTGKSHAFLVHILILFILQPEMEKIKKRLTPRPEWSKTDLAIYEKIKSTPLRNPRFWVAVQNNTVADHLCLRFANLISQHASVFPELCDIFFIRSGQEDYMTSRTPEMWQHSDYVHSHQHWASSKGQGRADERKAKAKISALQHDKDQWSAKKRDDPDRNARWNNRHSQAKQELEHIQIGLRLSPEAVVRLPHEITIKRARTIVELSETDHPTCLSYTMRLADVAFTTTDNLTLSVRCTEDTVQILDEAFRLSMTETAAAAGALCSYRIFACSPEQNPPFNIDIQLELHKKAYFLYSFAENIFREEKGKKLFTDLALTRRIHPQLAWYLNKVFLRDAQLRVPEDAPPETDSPPWWFLRSPVPEGSDRDPGRPAGPVVCINVNEASLRNVRKSIFNPSESSFTITYLYFMFAALHRMDPDGRKPSVLVIAPYKAQVEELQRAAARLMRQENEAARQAKALGLPFVAIWDLYKRYVQIHSAYTTAGYEADFVILTATRSETINGIGFLNHRLLSTCATRGRYTLVVVADFDHFKNDKTGKTHALPNLGTWAQDFRSNSYFEPHGIEDIAAMFA